MKHNETPALTGKVEFLSYRPARRPALTRVGGQFIVCTYIGSACVKRDYFASRAEASARIDEIREGVAL